VRSARAVGELVHPRHSSWPRSWDISAAAFQGCTLPGKMSGWGLQPGASSASPSNGGKRGPVRVATPGDVQLCSERSVDRGKKLVSRMDGSELSWPKITSG
jgi:hypothetical protein